MDYPSASEIYARASEIAKRNYPNGCPSASVLAGIVRDVARDLGLPRKMPPRHNA